MLNGPRIKYVTANDVFAALTDGGSISVEEFPGGDPAQAAVIAEKRDREAGDATLILSLTADVVDGAAIDTVWFHPDCEARLRVISRARAALEAAEAALKAVGYVDNGHLVEDDARAVKA